MRGIAAIAVMMHHLQHAFGHGGPFVRTYLFVDFFFLLSGFVLTLAAEERMNAGWGAAGFMRARIRRLWPTIAIGAFLGAVEAVLAGHVQDLALLLLLTLLFIPSPLQRGDAFPLNNPQWSLFAEFIANIVHALVLRRLSNRGLLVFAGLSGVLFAGWTFSLGAITAGFSNYDFYLSLPRVLWSYPVGIWLARKWLERPREPLAGWQTAMLLPLVVMVLLPLSPIGRAASEAIVVLAVLPALLWVAALARPPEQALPWLAWLGAISYPLYAIHLPVIRMIAPLGDGLAVEALAALAVVVAAHFVERAMTPRPAPAKLARAAAA